MQTFFLFQYSNIHFEILVCEYLPYRKSARWQKGTVETILFFLKSLSSVPARLEFWLI